MDERKKISIKTKGVAKPLLFHVMKSGIYYIKNTVTGQYYIGSSSDIKKRFRDHKWYFKRNIHHNQYLQNSWNKYGEAAFEFTIVLQCEMNVILLKEKELIVEYNSSIDMGGFNVNDPEHVFLGRKHSEETKAKLSAQKLGDKNPRYGKPSPRRGIPMTNEIKLKVSNSRKGIISHKGEETPSAKLSEQQVLEIRKKYVPRKCSTRMLAKEYHVTNSTITNIVNRKLWKHI